jgi:hypothetical protein
LKRQKERAILVVTGNQTETRASGRRSIMGIYKRHDVWWMSFVITGG